jgi:hypothetical protein
MKFVSLPFFIAIEGAFPTTADKSANSICRFQKRYYIYASLAGLAI